MDQQLIKSAVVGGLIGGFSALGLYCLMSHGKGGTNKCTDIQRIGTKDPRSSTVVIHDGKVYISGQVGEIEKLDDSDIKEQTKQTLAKIDTILASVGIGKDRILEARIWLRNMSTDFHAMNEVWNAWVDPNNKGTRYCVGAELARKSILVEVQVTAALK